MSKRRYYDATHDYPPMWCVERMEAAERLDELRRIFAETKAKRQRKRAWITAAIWISALAIVMYVAAR